MYRTPSFSKNLPLRHPQVLVVHLKRFSLGGTGSGRLGAKLNTIVEFPLEKLSLAEFSVPGAISSSSSSSSSSDCLYDLYAVSNHMGSLGGGHYTAHAKTGAGDAWCTFNDSRVSPVSSAHLGGSSAYVLFFHRRQ